MPVSGSQVVAWAAVRYGPGLPRCWTVAGSSRKSASLPLRTVSRTGASAAATVTGSIRRSWRSAHQDAARRWSASPSAEQTSSRLAVRFVARPKGEMRPSARRGCRTQMGG